MEVSLETLLHLMFIPGQLRLRRQFSLRLKSLSITTTSILGKVLVSPGVTGWHNKGLIISWLAFLLLIAHYTLVSTPLL